MGVVYRARQTALKRVVALKMIRPGGLAGAAELGRFQAEAEVIARLRHPHIVQVYDFGTHAGVPYFSLEFVDGGSLDRKLGGGPMLPAAAAALAEQLARAVHAAHQAGVVHRDLKPGNVLLAADGTPKVTDFGLAKQETSDVTRDGAVLGTPSYMAPEQARGDVRAVGPAADVYALGAILYELLTSRPPFRAATVLDTLAQVKNDEPVPPRRLQPGVPADLETVCLKCLAKDPGRRYATALALAEDLRRWQEGLPITARRAGRMERAWRWARRRRALAGLYATAAAALVLLGVSLWFKSRLGEAASEGEAARQAAAAQEAAAEAARTLAAEREYSALAGRARERIARQAPGWTWEALDELARAARLPAARDHLPELRGAAAACAGGVDVRRGRELAVGFGPSCCAFSPDGRLLALAQFKAAAYLLPVSVALVDPAGVQPTRTLGFPPKVVWRSAADAVQDGARALAFSPDGRWLVAGARSGMLHRWDLARPGAGPVSWAGHAAEVERLAFSPDGRALFTRDSKSLKRWGVPVWAEEARAEAPEGVADFDVDAAGGRVAAAGGGRVRFLSADTLRPAGPPLEAPAGVLRVMPGGHTLLLGAGGGLSLTPARPGRVAPERTLAGPEGARGHEATVTSTDVSPDGALVLSGSRADDHLRLWEAAGGRLVADLPAGVPGIALGAAFAPDGRSFAVATSEQALLYEVGGRAEQKFAAPAAGPVRAFAFGPDGALATVAASPLGLGSYAEVAAWPPGEVGAAAPRARHPFLSDGREEASVAFHPGGRWLAYGLRDGLGLWDRTLAEPARTLGTEPAEGVRFGPGRRAWAATDSNEVRGWDLASADRPAATWRDATGKIFRGVDRALAVAPGGRWVASGWRDGTVRLHRAADAAVEGSAACGPAAAGAVALSAGEGLAAAGTEAGDLVLLRVPGGEKVASARAHHDAVTGMAFAGDDLLASGSRDRTVKLWRCAGGLEELLTLPAPRPVRAVTFAPDGVRLGVLCEGERAVRVWHLDRLRARLADMGLAEGLPAFAPRPVPPPVLEATPPTAPEESPRGPNGLRAELFRDVDLRCRVKTRYDDQINRDWGKGSPDPRVPPDGFSVRWTGWLKAPKPGRYTLGLAADDGARLWLDGKLLIAIGLEWQPFRAEVELTGRPHELRVEYYELADRASVRLVWAQAGGFAERPMPPAALFHDRAAAEKEAAPADGGPAGPK
jgi:WD40 repeat protein/tRNA A-37 threonylcarbamoyl transferase component Bud32